MTQLENQSVVDGEMLLLKVRRAEKIADEIYAFDLVHPEGSELPTFSPGSHIKVIVPNGMVRQYSICNDTVETSHYSIAVKRDALGKGGSVSLADNTHAGDSLRVSPPRNDFPLSDMADSHLLIAGGIGITPILSMARYLHRLRKPFKLYYCTRSPESTAFLKEITDSVPSKSLTIHHDWGMRAKSFDFRKILSKPPRGAHVYCCGPRPLMQAVREMTVQWPAATVHFEDFGTSVPVRSGDDAFKVKLARSGVVIDVPAGVSILQALRNNGRTVLSSCETGTCGTCRTRLLCGKADHRDYVLVKEEFDSNIMVCVSRALSDELTLDL